VFALQTGFRNRRSIQIHYWKVAAASLRRGFLYIRRSTRRNRATTGRRGSCAAPVPSDNELVRMMREEAEAYVREQREVMAREREALDHEKQSAGARARGISSGAGEHRAQS